MGSPAGDLARLLKDLTRSVSKDRARLLESHGDPDEIVTALAGEAEQLVMENLQHAMEATAALMDVADTVAGPGARARAHRARAQALAYANRFDEALASLQQAVECADEAADEPAAARARLTMVHALARLGRYDDAITAGESAREGFHRHGLDQWAAKAEVNLGVTFRMRNDPARALEHFDRARVALADNPVDLAHVDSSRADALLELNQFADAEAAFASARDAFEKGGMMRAAAIVQGNLADVLSRQGRLQAALYHFEQARRHLEADRAAGDLARIESEQADALAGAGLLAEAAEAYAAALPALDGHGLVLEAARARSGLGRTLTALGRFEEASAMLARARDGFTALGNSAGTGRIALLEGELALASGDGTQAETLLETALALLEDRPAESAVAHRHLAFAALAGDDLDRTEQRIARALEAARQYNLAPLLADVLHLRARLRDRQGRTEEALADLRSAVTEIERVRGTLQADRFRAAYVENRSAVYEDLVTGLLVHPTADRLSEAFGVVEQARSRAMLDLVAGAVEPTAASRPVATDGSSGPLLEQVLRVRGELNALYSGLAENDARPDTVRRWRQDVDARERALQALEDRLAATQGLTGLFARPIDAARARSLIDCDTAVIEYFIAGDEVMAFVLRPDEVRCVRHLASRDDLQEHVELGRFQIERALTYSRQQANTSLVADARSQLRNLHEVLMAPLTESLGTAHRLVIVPHGLLHGVPFHALHDGNRYLIQDHEVLYLPSASLLSHLPPVPGPPAAGRSVIFGVADQAAPHIEREVRAAAAILPGATAFLGEDATWQRLLDEGSRAQLVHLACHGWFNPRRPLASGIKLADRRMTVRDVYGLGLGGAVVVLSGCETGRAAVAAGDDQVGLVRGFFAAGASALMMTLWPLHDETAEILVASIYKLWQNGPSDKKPTLAAALRAAQCRLMEENPHPIFWAPFVLVGRP